MPWFKVDDQLHSHPKGRRAGLPALGLWAMCGSWSMAYKTDGFVPDWVVTGWSNGRKLADQLVAASLWEPSNRNGEDGWEFHDWADFQPTSDEIEKERESARKRQRDRRQRMREGKSSANTKATGHA